MFCSAVVDEKINAVKKTERKEKVNVRCAYFFQDDRAVSKKCAKKDGDRGRELDFFA